MRQTDWSWNGFDYWCNICALCVVSNAVIFLLVVGVHAYSGPGWDDPCVRGRRTRHVVDILGTIQCLCLAFMLVSLGMAKLVSRDHVVRAGLTTGRVLARPRRRPRPTRRAARLIEGAAASGGRRRSNMLGRAPWFPPSPLLCWPTRRTDKKTI